MSPEGWQSVSSLRAGADQRVIVRNLRRDWCWHNMIDINGLLAVYHFNYLVYVVNIKINSTYRYSAMIVKKKIMVKIWHRKCQKVKIVKNRSRKVVQK